MATTAATSSTRCSPRRTTTEPVTACTDQEVRDQVVSLIAAGYDTTSAAIGWTLHAVLTHDAVAERVGAEIAAVVGDDDLDASHLVAMPYLDAVVSESLRLHPPAAFSGRKAVDDVEYAGHTIPAGSLVVYSAYEVQRDPAYWPEPERFAPERWLPGDPLHRELDPYTYVPFGGGYRRCIGFAMATQEIKAATVEVLRTGDAASPRPAPDPDRDRDHVAARGRALPRRRRSLTHPRRCRRRRRPRCG